MQLYPAIDIKNGKCVRLKQGQFNQETIYNDNPIDVIKEWAALGGTFIHVVDLDGALDGAWTNKTLIGNMVKAVDVPVQTGGGIRTLADIKERLDLGINRVIIGTMAIKNPAFVKEAIETFGADAIVVGIDAKDGYVATHGWEQVSSKSAIDVAKEMEAMGVKTIVYTDIAKDGMMSGPNVEQTASLVNATSMAIIASGGVSKMSDLDAIENIHAHGAILGKSLYEGAISLKEAINRFEKQ